jgi:predicted Zn-ribbon and HTH transcriptional regulator
MDNLNMNIKPSDMKPITCENCGGIYFRQVMAINKVSRLMTGAAKDTVVPVPVFRCDDCGMIPEEFQPVKVKGDGGKNS